MHLFCGLVAQGWPCKGAKHGKTFEYIFNFQHRSTRVVLSMKGAPESLRSDLPYARAVPVYSVTGALRFVEEVIRLRKVCS